MKVIFDLISSYAKNLKLKTSSAQGKIIDSSARRLLHERPFTREGNYLVFEGDANTNVGSLFLGEFHFCRKVLRHGSFV